MKRQEAVNLSHRRMSAALGGPQNLYLDFKSEVFPQVLNNHHQKGKLDPEGVLGISRTCYVGGAAYRSAQILKQTRNFC